MISVIALVTLGTLLVQGGNWYAIASELTGVRLALILSLPATLAALAFAGAYALAHRAGVPFAVTTVITYGIGMVIAAAIGHFILNQALSGLDGLAIVLVLCGLIVANIR